MTEVKIENGLAQAMQGYRDFLREAPVSALTPEAMRRLADLQLEKEFGILGGAELPTHEAAALASAAGAGSSNAPVPASIAENSESEQDFEQRVASEAGITSSGESVDLELPGGDQVEWAGPEEALELYDRILAAYPDYEHNDQVLYQKARAYDELGKTDEAIAVIEQLVARYPNSSYIDEVQFRRGEYFFTRRKYYEAELAYAAATEMGPSSPYYELALYKLGWTLYKQEFHEEALHKYIALLDYKISTGYDLNRSAADAEDETEERRVADTYRVISLSFSSLGGSDVVQQYFATNGHRSYEDRIYSHLGEFYLEKLRYNDAATSYKAFVELNPLHRVSPHFGMRVVEIYEAGGFPKLVLESKKEFAYRYGLQSAYWGQFKVDESPEVVSYLRSNLEDLATHHHAAFQDKRKADEKPENFREALHWYRQYLASFSNDAKAPSIHYLLADLLLEHEDFGEAAREYEHTAYDYSEHEQAAAAGYAAIFAHRENQKLAGDEQQPLVRNEAVTSTLKFVDTFPT
ncbi:MAG: tetratricopeptide repeat protein, partial [Deltaproteobacteria bacterium]|nr:tetratricopeptide repeat protein [Deltaproteobacteria bacterium]